MKTKSLVFTVGMLCLWAGKGYCASLGITLDGFLSTFETFMVGMGMVMGMAGLVGYIGSLFDNPFSNILAGSIGFFVKAGLLGGGTTLLGLLGLTTGAVLP